MFGKNDTLTDSNYQHAAAQPQQHDTHFGTAGGEFAAAPAAPQTVTPVEQFPAAEQPVHYEAPTMAAPTYAAPVAEVPAAAAPAFAEAPQPAAFEPVQAAQPAEEPQLDAAAPAIEEAATPAPAPTTTISFSEMMARRNQQQDVAAPAAEAPAEETITPEAEQEPALTAESLEAMMNGEPEGLSAEQTSALQQALEALSSDDIKQTGGKTRVQAAALKVLVEKAQAQDENALSQLGTHGFELIEKVAEGLPPASATLDKLVESVGALVGSELIVAADSKAQQTDALLGIAQGVSLQGHVAATQYNDAQEQQSFAQREAEKKAARQEGLPTGQYL